MADSSYLDSTANIVTPLNEVEELTEDQKKFIKESREQRDYLSYTAKPALQHAKDARRRFDYEWMVRELFWKGYQFSRYQPTTQTVILASRQTARIPINITR